MKITALEEYGLRCMVLLTRCGPGETLALSDFKMREGLSMPYAAKLLMILKKSGLVKAVRGRKGGYALAKPAERIALKEIFDALGEPSFSPSHCERHTGTFDICVHEGDCRVRDIWQSFGSFIDQVLDRISLADAAQGKLKILDNVSMSVESGERVSSRG